MTVYFAVKFLHILGATTILGTGTGIAFFMLMAHRSQDAAFIAKTAGVVVIADLLFTLTAVLLQPVTGFVLMRDVGYSFQERWLLVSLGLYAFAGLFWLPVVWIQAKMRDLAQAAVSNGTELPQSYFRLFRIWFIFGFPGFGSVMLILWLMIARPNL